MCCGRLLSELERVITYTYEQTGSRSVVYEIRRKLVLALQERESR